METKHLPVLEEEVITMLSPVPGSLQIDATVGGGGHTERILEASTPDGRLLGLDADGVAIARVRARLARQTHGFRQGDLMFQQNSHQVGKGCKPHASNQAAYAG